ncbi:MAG: hypothetical protein ACD_10C00713G0001 [uncultured bacterium]|nr:MAG: hypothetical protein ACD_10C00713G0001 [uncultured bacterium]
MNLAPVASLIMLASVWSVSLDCEPPIFSPSGFLAASIKLLTSLWGDSALTQIRNSSSASAVTGTRLSAVYPILATSGSRYSLLVPKVSLYGSSALAEP